MAEYGSTSARGFFRGLFGSFVISLCFLVRATAADSPSDSSRFFETRIRPLLAENCFKCHSAESEKVKGGLRLDSGEDLLKGGESGPAVVPGDPEKSLLIKAVRYTDKDLQMPPKNKKLSDRQIADLTTWVKMGAPWPKDKTPRIARKGSAPFEISEKDRAYWAFQHIQPPKPPEVRQKAWIANPVDAFILADLEKKGLKPNLPATKRELVRRAYFDLIGLPPPPDVVDRFEHDRSPDAFVRLIDHLLALPQYGERWGRHWLDVARFAQSNGYERDGEKPLAWRYRDYVIKSFNDDKPYNRFILEQLAGDELPDASPESLVATGFQRLGVWDDEPDDKRMAEYDELDDIISTTSAAFLGLTLSCARCHDHKFDPISQVDYYQFLAFFRNVRGNEHAKYTLDSANYVPLASPDKANAWRRSQQAGIKELEQQLENEKNSKDEKAKLTEAIKKLKEDLGPFEWALAVREKKPIPTHVLARGNAASPGVEVQPAFLTVLGGQRPLIATRGSEFDSSGRRLALANWMASVENPLTARVMVNRLWQHHFGKGIVKTTTDFGHAGALPTNQPLLDWLASEFIRSGWSIKKLHRLILLSNAYQMSSRCENLRAQEIDPGDDLFWRQNLRRLEAEAIGDSILAASGELNLKMGGRGFFPRLAGEVLAGASRPGLDWQKSPLSERSRRAVYSYIRRTMLVPSLETFDYSNTASPLGERPVTTVAPQALMLLNDDFIQHQAAAFAARLTREAPDTPARQIERAYQIAFGRPPDKRELQTAVAFLKRQNAAAQMIQSRLTFVPDAPASLSVEYMKQLDATNFLIGPRDDWSYYRGRWSAAYEGIRTSDRERGPFALWNGAHFSNALLQAKLTLQPASEFASILFHSKAEADEQRGYEVMLDPRHQRISLRWHGTNLLALASAEATIPPGKPIPIKIELAGPGVRVWINGSGAPILDAADQSLAGGGLIGIRSSGGPLSIDDFMVVADHKQFSLRPSESQASPHRSRSRSDDATTRALRSFCLLLLNLNEMIYVD